MVFHFLFSSCHVFTLVSVWNLTSHKKWTYCYDTRSWRNAEGLDQSPWPRPLCAVAVIQTKQKKPFRGSWDHSCLQLLCTTGLHHWSAPALSTATPCARPVQKHSPPWGADTEPGNSLGQGSGGGEEHFHGFSWPNILNCPSFTVGTDSPSLSGLA